VRPVRGVRTGLCPASIVPDWVLPGALGNCRFAVIPESVSVVVAAAGELIVTDAGLKLRPGMKFVVVVDVAVKTTVPVKLLTGVKVIVTGGIVPPRPTDTVGVVGVIVKSGHEPEVTVTMSGEVTTEPSGVTPAPLASAAASAGPFEPA
jgi:hypothetical protein